MFQNSCHLQKEDIMSVAEDIMTFVTILPCHYGSKSAKAATLEMEIITFFFCG